MVHKKGRKVGFIKKDGKQFAVPPKEKKELERRGKTDDPNRNLTKGEILVKDERERAKRLKVRGLVESEGKEETETRTDLPANKQEGVTKEAGFFSREGQEERVGNVLGSPEGQIAGVIGAGVLAGKGKGVKAGAGFAKKGIDLTTREISRLNFLVKGEGKITSKLAETINRDRQVGKIGARFKISERTAEIVYDQLKGNTGTQILNLMRKNKGKIIGGGIVGGLLIGRDILQINSMMVWLASDNIISGASIFARDKVGDVRFNGADPTEAVEELENTKEDIKFATSTINESSRKNPFLYPYRRLLQTNINVSTRSINRAIDIIAEIESPELSPEEATGELERIEGETE